MSIIASVSVMIQTDDYRGFFATKLENIAAYIKANDSIGASETPVVIIIGGGLSGISAALAASEEGAVVYILDKSYKIGGNSIKATSGLNAVGTKIQSYQQTADSCSMFYKDTLCAGLNLNQLELVSTLVSESNEAYEWLSTKNANLDKITTLGGHSQSRTHFPSTSPIGRPMATGAQLIYFLNQSISNDSNINVMLNTTVTEIITDNGEISGVRYIQNGVKGVLRGQSVVITTGGYAGSQAMIETYAPKLSNLPSTNDPSSSGDGISLASSLGADIIEMDKIQIHPTAFIDPLDPHKRIKYLAPEALRGAGALLVNSDGKRFINELASRRTVSNAMLKESSVFLVMNDEMGEKVGPNFYFYKSKKFFTHYSDALEAAHALNLDVDLFFESLNDTGIDTDDSIYIAQVTPALHYSIGGLRINTDGNVLKADLTEIIGLYSAGEASAGIHGGDRLGGNSLTECVVMGRRAGSSAVVKRLSETNALRSLSTSFRLTKFASLMREIVDDIETKELDDRVIVYPHDMSQLSYVMRMIKSLSLPSVFNKEILNGVEIRFTPKVNIQSSSIVKKTLLNSNLVPKVCKAAIYVTNKGDIIQIDKKSPLFELYWSLNGVDVHLVDLDCGTSEIYVVSALATSGCEILFENGDETLVRKCKGSPRKRTVVANFGNFVHSDGYLQRQTIEAVKSLINGK